jgi:FkbM family methyltransferase
MFMYQVCYFGTNRYYMTRGFGMQNHLYDMLSQSLQWYIRYFPIATGKQRLVSAFRRLSKPESVLRQTTLTGYSVPVQMNCDLTKYIQRQLYFFGSYELTESRLWERFSRQASVIFDVGANVGLYSILAGLNNSLAAVHAFEPTPELQSRLQANISLNGLQNIVVNTLAVGKQRGIAQLNYCYGSDRSNEGMNYISDAKPNASEVLPVRTISLDEYCQERQIERIDLLKVDVEGGEYDVLFGAKDLLDHKAIHYVFIELVEWAANRSSHSTLEIKRLLENAGYRLYDFDGVNFVEVDAGSAIANGNFVASHLNLYTAP